MAVKRYATPNHPRWNDRTNGTTLERETATRRYGRRQRRRCNRRRERTDGEPLRSRESTGDDATVELTNAPNWTLVKAELPGISPDDVRITAAGDSIRLRTERSDASVAPNDVDRTLTLTEDVDTTDAAVVYCDPVLTVVLPKTDEP